MHHVKLHKLYRWIFFFSLSKTAVWKYTQRLNRPCEISLVHCSLPTRKDTLVSALTDAQGHANSNTTVPVACQSNGGLKELFLKELIKHLGLLCSISEVKPGLQAPPPVGSRAHGGLCQMNDQMPEEPDLPFRSQQLNYKVIVAHVFLFGCWACKESSEIKVRARKNKAAF